MGHLPDAQHLPLSPLAPVGAPTPWRMRFPDARDVFHFVYSGDSPWRVLDAQTEQVVASGPGGDSLMSGPVLWSTQGVVLEAAREPRLVRISYDEPGGAPLEYGPQIVEEAAGWFLKAARGGLAMEEPLKIARPRNSADAQAVKPSLPRPAWPLEPARLSPLDQWSAVLREQQSKAWRPPASAFAH